ncbi:hypothetical protein CSHISOI_02097 [Colletotrichum shisoi]|uniref:Uncharacterized protein n=1 Tax=Colletotrichum shisoi TaxID=2078593 RepID=A0A5Q4C211_9PEZI|nr:hypothetical protein CSHISOI_02097 [Colletotrichum shisoi]
MRPLLRTKVRRCSNTGAGRQLSNSHWPHPPSYCG